MSDSVERTRRAARAARVSPGFLQSPLRLEPNWQKWRMSSQLRVLNAPFSRIWAISFVPAPHATVFRTF